MFQGNSNEYSRGHGKFDGPRTRKMSDDTWKRLNLLAKHMQDTSKSLLPVLH